MPKVALRDNSLTLPEELRAAYHIREGDLLDVEPAEGGTLIKPSPDARRRAALARIRRAQAEVRLSPELQATTPEESEREVAAMVEEATRDDRG